MYTLLDGKVCADSIYREIYIDYKRMKSLEPPIIPGLAVILVGDDPASHIYVNSKEKKAKELGFFFKKVVLNSDITFDFLKKHIESLNIDNRIDGIIIQSPLPSHIDENKIIEFIDPDKDVDGFHPINVGRLLIGRKDCFSPCTPFGIIKLFEYYNIDTTGKKVVIVGRSNIVGKPMFSLLINRHKFGNATVTVAHSFTKDIGELTKKADIIIMAVGKTNFLTGDMVNDGAVVVDVGINRVSDSSKKRGYRLVGDVSFDEVSKKASYITPVPGGVGPMTIAMLMYNTLKACKKRHNLTLA